MLSLLFKYCASFILKFLKYSSRANFLQSQLYLLLIFGTIFDSAWSTQLTL